MDDLKRNISANTEGQEEMIRAMLAMKMEFKGVSYHS